MLYYLYVDSDNLLSSDRSEAHHLVPIEVHYSVLKLYLQSELINMITSNNLLFFFKEKENIRNYINNQVKLI